MNRKLTLAQRRSVAGVLFVLPWLIGFLFLFLTPLLQSLQFSFSNLKIDTAGYSLIFVGLKNYADALLVDAEFNRTLTDSVGQMLLHVPLILFFSLFTATLVNQKFRGRGIARAIFFLPVVIASGAIATTEANNLMTQLMMNSASQSTLDTAGASTGQLQSGIDLAFFLEQSGFAPWLIDYLLNAVDQIYTIISKSGVQILIFLAGLQSIPANMYEAAKIEGATGYQMFWKITFPMVSPLIMTNIIYTIIDSFSDNDMTAVINNAAFKSFNFGLSSAMVWLYSLVVGVILAVVGYLVSKRVFYNG